MAFSADDPEKNAKLFDDLDEAMEVICSMKMAEKKGEGQHPNQKGLALTTINIKKAVPLLLRKGLKVIPLGFLVSSDAVENYFSMLRGRNPAPTSVLVTRGVRVISFCQVKANKRGNCHDDGDSGWLQQLNILHDMLEVEIEDVEFEYQDVMERDLADENALSYALGVVFRRTICSHSHCLKCIAAFVRDSPQDLSHRLIAEKTKYSGGALDIYPNAVAYTIFMRIFENYFDANWKKLTSPDVHDKFLDTIHQDIVKQYPDIPKCHLRLILQRFLKFRTIFKAGGLNRVVKDNKKRAKNEAQASKSMAGYYVNK